MDICGRPQSPSRLPRYQAHVDHRDYLTDAYFHCTAVSEAIFRILLAGGAGDLDERWPPGSPSDEVAVPQLVQEETEGTLKQ